jgi:hypothetical protein
MCCANCGEFSFADLLQDPLTQLVMRSDGVTEQDMLELRDQVCRAQSNHRPPAQRDTSTSF